MIGFIIGVFVGVFVGQYMFAWLQDRKGKNRFDLWHTKGKK